MSYFDWLRKSILKLIMFTTCANFQQGGYEVEIHWFASEKISTTTSQY